MKLMDRAIYLLPNGRELVACMTCDGGTVLFSASASEHGLYDEHNLYELNSEGRLLVDGRLTAWQIDDLIETGRVSAAEMTSILAEGSRADSETMN